MKLQYYISLCGVLAIFTCSCATIFSRSNYEVRITSDPQSADVVVYNRKGLEVYSGKTPAHVRLKPGGGYFKKAIYEVEFTKQGFAKHTFTLKADINALYFGNLLIGGAIGYAHCGPGNRSDVQNK
jgi:hypothetical protein